MQFNDMILIAYKIHWANIFNVSALRCFEAVMMFCNEHF